MKILSFALILLGVLATGVAFADFTQEEGRCFNDACSTDTNECPAGVGQSFCTAQNCTFGDAIETRTFGFCDSRWTMTCWLNTETVNCQIIYTATKCIYDGPSTGYCHCPPFGEGTPGYPKPADCHN